jgi:predicted lipoprotein with Yx(FWY)xxD motif
MRFNHVVAVAALGAVALAACGGGSHPSGAAKPPSVVPITMTTSAVAVQRGDTSLGNVLVSSSGLTIYGLMKDTKSNSTCVGACAKVWPPVLVDKGWTVASGLDRSLFSTILRTDGTRQLVAGKWPLYTFSGDTKPGDLNGEGSGGVWFAVGTMGKLVKSAPSSATTNTAGSGY